MQRCKETLLVLTNIPTPYRTNFFNRLSKEISARGGLLVVAYCAKTEWNRHWDFVAAGNEYEFVFLPGISPRFGQITFHFNPSVLRLIDRIQPKWLLSAGSWNMPTGMMAKWAAGRSGICSLFWSEGHADAVLNRSGLIASVRRWLLQKYDAFAVPNQRSEQFIFSETGRTPLCLRLPNTVDDSFYVRPSADQRRESRSALGIADEDVLYVQVSQLEDRKGVLELCQAMARVFGRNPAAKLAIIGTGGLMDRLRAEFSEEIARSRLILPGTQNGHGVRGWLRAADVFVLVSKRDPNPLSVIEAALCGLPLLMSRYVGNSPELLVDGTTGWSVNEVTVDEIAQAASRALAAGQTARAAMGVQSEILARAKFTTDKVVGRFVDALQRLP